MLLMRKMKKITTNFEPVNNEDVKNKTYLEEKIFKINGHISFVEKNDNDFKLQYMKQSEEDVLIRRAVRTTIPKLYVKGLFDGFPIADEVLQDFWFVTRQRGFLEEVSFDLQ